MGSIDLSATSEGSVQVTRVADGGADFSYVGVGSERRRLSMRDS